MINHRTHRRRLQQAFAAGVLSLVSQMAFAVESDRPRIGLALSGGGARGAAHIGVLRGLEARHIPIDYIAGTSMGAIVGALYASGYSVDDIETITRTLDWNAAFDDDVAREKRSFRRKQDDAAFLSGIRIGIGEDGLKLPAGVVTGQSIELILNRLFAPVSHVDDFDQLKIPFRAVAADIVSSEAVVMGSGSLATAVRASMSIPGVITPVEREGRLLVDGGVANNLPVSVVRDMGADVVIAVDISTAFLTREELNDVIDVADQLTNFLTRKNTHEQIELLAKGDVLLTPKLGDISASAFDRVSEAVIVGEDAVGDSPDLAALAVADTPAEQVSPLRDFEGVRVGFIRFDNQSRVPDSVLENRIDMQQGDVVDFDRIEADVDRLFGLGYFSIVTYRIVTEGDRTGLEYALVEKPWGPNYLLFGLRFSSSEDTDSHINLSAGYLMTNVNRLGAEFRAKAEVGTDRSLSADFYQPLNYRFTPFVQPMVQWYSNQYNVFFDDTLLAEFTVEAVELDLGVGVELDNWGVFKTGLRYLDGIVDQRVGVPVVEEESFRDSLVYASLGVDTLDSLYFPRQGYRAGFTWQQAETGLGADEAYQQGLADLTLATRWHGNSVTGRLKYFRTFANDVPVQSAFRAGGFLNLSGFQYNQLTGLNYGLASVVFMHQLEGTRYFPIYLGASFERGNVWNENRGLRWGELINAYSTFVGIDTLLGPFFVGLGYNEESSAALYMRLDSAL